MRKWGEGLQEGVDVKVGEEIGVRRERGMEGGVGLGAQEGTPGGEECIRKVWDKDVMKVWSGGETDLNGGGGEICVCDDEEEVCWRGGGQVWDSVVCDRGDGLRRRAIDFGLEENVKALSGKKKEKIVRVTKKRNRGRAEDDSEMGSWVAVGVREKVCGRGGCGGKG